jgi:hypothetical protein
MPHFDPGMVKYDVRDLRLHALLQCTAAKTNKLLEILIDFLGTEEERGCKTRWERLEKVLTIAGRNQGYQILSQKLEEVKAAYKEMLCEMAATR